MATVVPRFWKRIQPPPRILSRQHVIRLAELLFAQFDGDGLSIAV